MKLILEDFGAGLVKVLVNDKNDLWHLENIITPGDFVTAKTPRTIFVEREDSKEKAKRKVVLLKIKVEKIEFNKQSNKLRVKGKIIECPDDVQKGSYHTIEVGFRSMLTIEKEKWSDEQIERLHRAKTFVRTADDRELVNEFYVRLKKDDGLVAYGFDNVKTAAEFGAVKTILVSEEKIREKDVEALIKLVESKRGAVVFVSDKKFNKEFGLGAILRFKFQ